MQRMLLAMTWVILGGTSVAHATTITSTFDFVGQSFGGQDVSVDIGIGDLRPVGNATLELEIRGDYDTMGELVTVSLDGTTVGKAGTDMGGTFLGTNRVDNAMGDISFARTLSISLSDLISAFQSDGVATLLFDRSSLVGGGANSRISGTLTFAAVPEPSTWMLTSLGLACAGCFMLKRRRQNVQHTATA